MRKWILEELKHQTSARMRERLCGIKEPLSDKRTSAEYTPLPQPHTRIWQVDLFFEAIQMPRWLRTYFNTYPQSPYHER